MTTLEVAVMTLTNIGPRCKKKKKDLAFSINLYKRMFCYSDFHVINLYITFLWDNRTQVKSHWCLCH